MRQAIEIIKIKIIHGEVTTVKISLQLKLLAERKQAKIDAKLRKPTQKQRKNLNQEIVK